MSENIKYWIDVGARWAVSIFVAILFPLQMMVGAVQHEVAEQIAASGEPAAFSQVLRARQNFDAAEDEYDRLIKDKLELESMIEANAAVLESQEFAAPDENSAQQEAGLSLLDVKIAEKQLVIVDADLAEMQSAIERNRALLPAAQNLASVRGSAPFSWMCGWFLCPVDTPPSILPFFLIFSAGFFGAILLEMILIVYPNPAHKNAAGQTFIVRVGLGGVIALALFVVLASGSAIMGSSEALYDGRGNIYALSSIGILAGMFSDRVAAWLSGRADAFFSSETGGDGKASAPAASAVQQAHPVNDGAVDSGDDPDEPVDVSVKADNFDSDPGDGR